jgi:hypothetical protein
MLAAMDLAAASVGPWLFLGVVLGVLLTGAAVIALAAVRRSSRSRAAPAGDADERTAPEQVGVTGWIDDDLPGFLDHPPGIPPDDATPGGSPTTGEVPGEVPLGPPEPSVPTARRAIGRHAAAGASTTPEPSRLLLVLTVTALLLIGAAAALAALADRGEARRTAAVPPSTAPTVDEPTWDVPDLTAPPAQPEPGDPGAGRLATASVPLGADGVFARLSFEGLVLERRAVGITAAYPSVSVTAAEVPGGPALAHVRLPVWNCLTDSAPDDPVAAGCRRLPTEYAELPSPALSVTEDGEGLRISGRFPTYVRPSGSGPEWTGRVYPLAVHVDPDGDHVTGSVHLGTERTESVDDPRLSELRRGR